MSLIRNAPLAGGGTVRVRSNSGRTPRIMSRSRIHLRPVLPNPTAPPRRQPSAPSGRSGRRCETGVIAILKARQLTSKRKEDQMDVDGVNMELVSKFIADAWAGIQEWWGAVDENGKSPKDRFVESICEKARNAKIALSPSAIKMAISYRDESFASWGFADMIRYVKTNFKIKPGMRICVLKSGTEVTVLDVISLDSEGRPVFSCGCPWCHIVVSNLSSDLLQKFGSKSMLVLK